MRIDIPTLIFISSIVFTTLTLALFVQYRTNRAYLDISSWLSGTVLQALGFLFMLGLNDRRFLVLAALANPLAFVGLLFLGVGTNRFLGQPTARRKHIAAAVLFLVAYAIFIFGFNSPRGRSAVVSAANCWGAFLIAKALFVHRKRHFAETAGFLAAVFAFYGLFHALVSVYSIVLSPAGSTYADMYRDPLRIVLFIVPIVCGILWTLGFIIMVNQRLNAEIEEEKRKLQQAEGEIRLLLTEKELILKEVHHRIKNNMSTVASLLSLQATLSLDQATVDALKEAVNRLRSMTTLYDVLYRAPSYTEISVKDYLPPLIDEIISNFANSGSVKVVKRVDDFILGAKKLQPLGIIVNELLTNAMKYAFPEGKDGEIEFSATETDGRVTVVVQDNGQGIPETVDFENSAGFGFTLVEALAKQLGGSVRVERMRGARVVLEFPV